MSDRERIEQQIRDLEAKLADTDYKVRKNIEYEKCELELPYPWDELHAEAQPIRDEINRLQQELEELNAE